MVGILGFFVIDFVVIDGGGNDVVVLLIVFS